MKWRCFVLVEYDTGQIELRRLDSCAALDAPHGYVDAGCDSRPRETMLNPNPEFSNVLARVGGDFET